jgi:hypothetical protein
MKGGRIMKRLLILACMAPLFAGCDGRFIKDDFLSSECLENGNRLNLEGYTVTAIAYGDSHLVVIPVSKLRPNSEFRFKLLPESKKKTDEFNWVNAWVEISSEDDQVGDDDDMKPSNWLNVAGSHSGDDGWLVACVPDLEVGREIKYKVSVWANQADSATEPALGILDPRAVLIPE